MRYEIETINPIGTEIRECGNRECAIRILKSDYNRNKGSIAWWARGILKKVYKDGRKAIIMEYDTSTGLK